MACERTYSRTIVSNAEGASSTGTAIARVSGLSSLLFVGFFLAYFSNSKARPASFGTNVFDVFGRVRNQEGEAVRLSDTPINNDNLGNQAAPDGWEGSTTLDELELEHAFEGIAEAGMAGQWQVIVRLEPSDPGMPAELFEELASRVSLTVDRVQAAT